MVQADPKDAIIRKQIERIDFGFYTDEDVRARSICEVTSSVTVDALNTPLPNGLYDPRMGCTGSDSGPCPTCACGYQTCPGHFGHIELCVPVYHPLLFEKILAILRVKCWSCHKLKAPPRVLQVFKAKFQLVQLGRYTQAIELDDLLASSMNQRRMEGKDATQNFKSIEEAGKRLDSALEEITNTFESSLENGPVLNHSRSSYEEAYHRELVSQLNTHCKTSKSCPHCGAQSPRIRQDSSNKFFQAPLSDTAKRHNAAEGVKIRPALTKKDEEEGDEGNGYDSDDTRDKDAEMADHDDDEEGEKKGADKRDKYMHPAEVQAQLKRTWETSPDVCNAMFAIQGHEIFFMQAIPVPPSRFRPPMALGGMMVEHVQNGYLSKMLTTNELIRTAFASGGEAQGYKDWIELQTFVNCFMDSSKDPGNVNDQQPGIRQLLERKEGIFRKHMMGKRVNFACRSVISPDPYVGTNEIGIPRYFAETLTYPTPVTDINIQEMRTLVERGPNQYPGARWIEFPHRRVDLSKMDEHKREAAAAQLLAWAKKGGKPAIVGRQLRDGDMVLMNRQPTLHKPGIMAHEVRVLHNPTQKTIRMHYANCNTYNADFDGDEMNCHFPQSDLARAEAEYIAKTDLQFIVPTDGSPLRGLIQDHVVAGVKLTKRDTFLEKWEYQQLLYAALASLPRLELIRSDANIELMPPAIIRPKELWTGKQVISTLLNHLRKGNDRDGYEVEPFPGISTERKTKTPGAAFGEKNEEHLVLIRDGELLRGVLDKSAFGATDYSLVHAVYQAYGPEKAGLLLNSLGRLFTAYLQFYSGHSCRMEDLILTKEADQTRRNLINKAYNVGSRAAKAWADSEGGKVPIELDEESADRPLKPVEAASSASKVRNLLSGNEGMTNFAHLDGFMMSKLNPLASEIVKACLPDGLAVKFPINTFGIMCSTGAKGSIVNQSQVSCALGQQALEGRRVPRLASGRTLPSFAPYDVNPRADGFVMDRFLTGIRPQEYYFHCMAGREGLVDTAVKTSRSGYLQRCLVKHLEELKVCYDHTVRNGEGGVVQFLYGEDGLDPTKASYLDGSSSSFEYIARNHKSLARRHKSLPGSTIDNAVSDVKRLEALSKNSEDLLQVGSFVKARRLRVGSLWERGALCRGWYDAVVVKYRKGKPLTLDIEYLKDGEVAKKVPIETDFGPGKSMCSVCTVIKPAAADPILSSGTKAHRFGTSGACVSERFAGAAVSALERNKMLGKAMKSNSLSASEFGGLVAAMYGAAMCAPGEAVGSIAAQSVGEPSTQMTLNTFHLAGAGANVTLGIPRLREIIMTASRVLKTPTMSVPLHSTVTEKEATRLTRSFAKLTLNELIAGHRGIIVRETLAQSSSGLFERAYYVTLKFHPAERIKEAFGLNLSEIAKVVSKSFVPALAHQMKLELRRSAADGDMATLAVEGGESQEYVSAKDVEDESPKSKPRKQDDADVVEDDADDDDDDSDDEMGEEDGVAATRAQAASYGDRDEDENSTASRESLEDEEAKDATQDNKATPESGFDVNAILDAYDEEALKIDKKANAIHLRPLRVDPMARPLLMVGLVETAAAKTLVRSRKNIDQAFVNDEDGGRGRCLQTAGVNFEELWRLDMVDHNRLLSNDIWAVRCAYGVEAARNNIVGQIRSVFGAYGIEVDMRHLSLIADYMTYGGEYSAMNRICMRDSSSPFLQMSFETTAQFMTHAALTGANDALLSPSANIVVGQPVRHGTGAFTILAK